MLTCTCVSGKSMGTFSSRPTVMGSGALRTSTVKKVSDVAPDQLGASVLPVSVQVRCGAVPTGSQVLSPSERTQSSVGAAPAWVQLLPVVPVVVLVVVLVVVVPTVVVPVVLVLV